MLIAHDITQSERVAVKRHLVSGKTRLSATLINKLLSKCGVSLENK